MSDFLTAEDEYYLDCYDYVDCEADQSLAINIVSEKITQNSFTLLGGIVNSGEQDWHSLDLKAELFDSDGAFIEVCRHSIYEKLAAGSSVNFKLDCSEPLQIELENYNSYEVKIIDAINYSY